MPFGGFRESGLRRELGPEGLQSFLEPGGIGGFPSCPGDCADLSQAMTKPTPPGTGAV
jgi:hypothetical protein